MMRSKEVLLLGCVAAAIVLSAAWAQAAGMPEPKVEYSADQYMGAEGQTMKSKVYHAPGKQRMEMDLGGPKQVVITRFDKNLSWILMADEKMYMETTLEGAKTGTRDIRQCAMTQKTVGREVVNGVSTTRSQVEASCPDNSSYSGTMWTAGDGIMVKLDAVAKGGSGGGGRMLMELKNLKIGKQDPQMFEVPPGYAKIDMPGGMTPSWGGIDTKGMMKAPSPPAPRPSEPRDTGRSYTAQPRDTGRAYTALPRAGESKETGALDKALDVGKKLRGLFGR